MTVFHGAPRLVKASAAPANKAAARPADKALADMTVRELAAICAAEGIDVPSKPRKADLVAAIEAARGQQ